MALIEPPLRQQLANPFLGKLESAIRPFRRKRGEFRSRQNCGRLRGYHDRCLSSTYVQTYPDIFAHGSICRPLESLSF